MSDQYSTLGRTLFEWEVFSGSFILARSNTVLVPENWGLAGNGHAPQRLDTVRKRRVRAEEALEDLPWA